MTFPGVKRFPPRPADFRVKSAPQYPYNELPESPELSEPRYEVGVERHIYVPVSDGLKVAVDVYRPEAEGKFPALLAMSNYTKELQGTDSPSLCNEAGDIEFFVKRGYAHVIADSRGSGRTGGEFALFNDREIQDGAELVEWIASQSWCDGNVGMIGMSYFAVVQLLIAKKNPPHLKCIFAYDPIYDLYRDCCYHGGKMSLFDFLMAYFWIADHLVFQKGMKLAERKMNWASLIVLAINFIAQRHKFDDDWMRERSVFWREEELKVPLYIGSGWEYAVGLHLRGVFDGFREAAGPKRMLVGPPQVPFRPYSSWRLESLRWYDFWLKGMKTGIDSDPPVNIWVMGRNRWRSEAEWPLARTKYAQLHLRPQDGRRKIGRLSLKPPSEPDKPLRYLACPLTPALFGLPQLVYRSPILCSEVEVTGHIVLKLHASCSARDTSFQVRFCDEDEDGSYRVLSRGWLKASHRDVDEERSLPYRPFHPHTEEHKLERGKVYEYLVEIWPVSNLFLTGHRIRLEVSCAESLYHDFPYAHFPSLNTGMVEIHSSLEHPSTLSLPLIDSELDFGHEGGNILFGEKPTNYFVTRGDERKYGPANEFTVE